MSNSLQLQNVPRRQRAGNQLWQTLFNSQKKISYLLMALTITAVSAMMHPAAAIICGRMFGSFNKYNSGLTSLPQMSEDISVLCLWLAMLGCLSWIIESCFLSSWITYGERQAMEARKKLFNSLINKEMAWYDLRDDGLGSLLARIETLVKEFQSGLSQPLGFIVYEIFGSLISLGVAFFRSWQLTILILGILPLMAIALWYLSIVLKSAIHNQQLYLAHASKYACASIQAGCTVKAYNAQNYELRRYKNCLKYVTKYYMIQARVNASQLAVVKLLISLCFVGGFWLGLYLVIHGKDSGNVIIAFYTALAVVQSIEIISSQSIYALKGLSASHVLDLLSIEPQSQQRYGIRYETDFLEKGDNDIELKRVSFSYPKNPHQNVINDASLLFPAGKTTYIVGRSGSGKSTIGGLLLNFYTPHDGDIIIGGISIQDLPREWLHKNITFVDQEVPLFNETIFQNIALGCDKSVSKEDVMNAGKVVDLESMLRSQPHGLDTMISQSGKSLSGGQRQKIAITRARLRDSPVLILDEATSGMEQKSCHFVNNEIRKWRQGKTTIIITHDVSQILDDEYVFVVDKGFVIKKGIRKNLVFEVDEVFTSLSTDRLKERPQVIGKSPKNLTQFYAPIFTALDSNNSASSFSDQKSQTYQPSQENNINLDADSDKKPMNTIKLDSNLSFDFVKRPLQALNQDSELGLLETRSGLTTRLSRWWRKKSRESKIYFSVSSTELRNKFSLASINVSCSRSHSYSIIGGDSSSKNPQSNSGNNISQSKLKLESLKSILSSVWPRLSPKKKLDLIIGIFACCVTSVATPLFAYFISNLMKLYEITGGNQLKEGSRWAVALLGIGIVDSISSYCAHYYLERVGQAWVTSLRVECLRVILEQPKSWLDQEINSPSMLTQLLDCHAEEMRNLIGHFFVPIFTTFWMLSISIIWALSINWKLAAVSLSCGPVIYICSLTFNWTTTRYEDKCSMMTEEISKIFSEVLTNIRVVRGLGLESHFQRKHQNALNLAYNMGLRRSVFSGFAYGFVSDTLTFLNTVLVVYYGMTLIINNKLSVFGCFKIINLLLFGLGHSLTTISLIPQINSSRLAASRILSLTRLQNIQSSENKGTERLVNLFPVVLKDLNFTYPKNVDATLKRINLKINHDSFTVITGSSGSGKSTIASILLGFYPPDYSPTSSLSFAGNRLQESHIGTIRYLIGFVSQDPVIFPDSIYANIIYGLAEHSQRVNMNAVRKVAEKAGILDFIDSLEKGFLTIIGDGGLTISRGQAKRITIARALIRDPKLLIMDEPTSGLDSHSASNIRRTIQDILHHSDGCAIIVISHSIEMMAISDHILILEHGEIVERGDFYSLWKDRCSVLWKITRGEGTER